MQTLVVQAYTLKRGPASCGSALGYKMEGGRAAPQGSCPDSTVVACAAGDMRDPDEEDY